MALTPDTNQSFYREVDEELRREQLGSFWTRYGKMLLAALVLLAIAGAGYAYWRSEETKKAAAQSETLDKVITDLGEGREKGVASQLATLAASDNEGYRATALLTQADLALGKGDAKAAAAIYAARKGIRTGVVADRFGGQVLDTLAIENFVSVKETEGPKFAVSLEEHVKHYDVDIMNLQRAAKLEKNSAYRQIVDDGLAAQEQHGKLTDPVEAHDWLHGSLARSEASINSKLGGGLAFLATVGATAPFIGLFGTVWGIMTSFKAIAVSKNTSLAVVAPGIAEALFATALGLLAAIPAVIFYNRFNSDVARHAARLEGFADEFSAILSRQIDERISQSSHAA